MTGVNGTPSNSARIAISDLVFVLGTLFAVKTVLLKFDALWTYAGPIALLASLGVATVCLRLNNEGWGDLGLRRPKSILVALLWTVGILVVTMALGIVIESVVASTITPPDGAASEIDQRYANRFADVPGNLPVYLYWLAISWIIGGFTEELLFRGMLISRFERVFSFAPFAVIIAVILQAVIFGQQHLYYQGIGGALATGAIAFVSGGFYLLLKRNLWPLTLSHGLANTIGLTLLYTGFQPPA